MALLIKNARLADCHAPMDILVQNETIAEIAERIDVEAAETVDAAGNLVAPPFVDPHIHLDAVLSVGDPRFNESGTLLEGIAIWGERKPHLDKQTIKENARKAVYWEAAHGVRFIRAHADSTDPTLKTVEALLELKDEIRDLVELQVVAFPQDGILTRPDGAKLLEQAVEMGCDAVGAIPHNEMTREDGVRSVEFVFELAKKYDRQIDIHCDETGDPASRFVEVMAKEAILAGNGNRVTASHVTSMHNFNNDYALKLIGLLLRSGLNVVTNPFDNSVLQNRTDGYPRRRGHTRVDELDAAGVNVCVGHDSIMDPWYPMGIGSMLAAAYLLMHTAHLSGRGQIDRLWDMITVNSAKTMNVMDRYGIEVGKPANFNILDADSPFEAIRLQAESLYSFRKGKIILKTEPARRLLQTGDGRIEVDFRR